MSVRVAVRIDYVEFDYVSGGLRVTVDGVPLVRYDGDEGNEYLEYLLDTTLSNVLRSLETVVREGAAATAKAEGSVLEVSLTPAGDGRTRIALRGTESIHPASRRGYVVETEALCEEVITCARKVAWACEADAAAIDWPDGLAEFDRSGEDHFLRERVASLRRALRSE